MNQGHHTWKQIIHSCQTIYTLTLEFLNTENFSDLTKPTSLLENCHGGKKQVLTNENAIFQTPNATIESAFFFNNFYKFKFWFVSILKWLRGFDFVALFCFISIRLFNNSIDQDFTKLRWVVTYLFGINYAIIMNRR